MERVRETSARNSNSVLTMENSSEQRMVIITDPNQVLAVGRERYLSHDEIISLYAGHSFHFIRAERQQTKHYSAQDMLKY